MVLGQVSLPGPLPDMMIDLLPDQHDVLLDGARGGLRVPAADRRHDRAVRLGDVEFDQFFAGRNATTDDIGAKLFVNLIGQ
jgi:hypothetical protein